MSFKLLKGSQLGAFSIGHNVVLHWIQNSLSQQPEIVFSWNKRINWAYSFVKKKADGFLFFLKALFFRNRSFSNANWFYSKNRKIWKGNLYLSENRFSRNEMWCAVVNHNHMYHICAKGFLDSYFLLGSYWQNIIFQEIAPNCTYKNCSFKSRPIIGLFDTNCFYPLNVMAVTC